MPNSQLHILVFDVNPLRASIIEEGLLETGGLEVTVLTDANGLVEKVVALDPDVIFIDLENPNRDTIEQMFRVSREVKRPIAMFVDESDPETTKSAIRAGVSAYIIDGLRRDRIQPVVDVAISRFESYRELEQRATDAELQLAERKTIERAKALLMEKRAMTEPDAYEAIRHMARAKGKRMVEVAESLLTAQALGI